MKHILASVAVGVLTGLVVALIGVVIMAFGTAPAGIYAIGVFIRNVAALVGFIAGIYYYATNRTLA